VLANDGVALDTSVASESTIISDAPAAHFARHGAERSSPPAVERVFINLSLAGSRDPRNDSAGRQL
jgi:hypothetical protein